MGKQGPSFKKTRIFFFLPIPSSVLLSLMRAFSQAKVTLPWGLRSAELPLHTSSLCLSSSAASLWWLKRGKRMSVTFSPSALCVCNCVCLCEYELAGLQEGWITPSGLSVGWTGLGLGLRGSFTPQHTLSHLNSPRSSSQVVGWWEETCQYIQDFNHCWREEG